MVSWNLNTLRFGGDWTPQSSSDKLIASQGYRDLINVAKAYDDVVFLGSFITSKKQCSGDWKVSFKQFFAVESSWLVNLPPSLPEIRV